MDDCCLLCRHIYYDAPAQAYSYYWHCNVKDKSWAVANKKEIYQLTHVVRCSNYKRDKGRSLKSRVTDGR